MSDVEIRAFLGGMVEMDRCQISNSSGMSHYLYVSSSHFEHVAGVKSQPSLGWTANRDQS